MAITKNVGSHIWRNKWWYLSGLIAILFLIFGYPGCGDKEESDTKGANEEITIEKKVYRNSSLVDQIIKKLSELEKEVKNIKSAPGGADKAAVEAIQKQLKELKDKLDTEVTRIDQKLYSLKGTSGGADKAAVEAIQKQLEELKDELASKLADAEAERDRLQEEKDKLLEEEAERKRKEAERKKKELEKRLLKPPVPPYEVAVRVISTKEIFAENPDCGNVKWNRSKFILLAKKDGDDYPYYMMVTLPNFRPGRDDRKNARAFDAKAKRIKPGKYITIVSPVANQDELSYPGMGNSSKSEGVVTVRKIDGKHFIIVPIHLIEVLRSRDVN